MRFRDLRPVHGFQESVQDFLLLVDLHLQNPLLHGGILGSLQQIFQAVDHGADHVADFLEQALLLRLAQAAVRLHPLNELLHAGIRGQHGAQGIVYRLVCRLVPGLSGLPGVLIAFLIGFDKCVNGVRVLMLHPPAQKLLPHLGVTFRVVGKKIFPGLMAKGRHRVISVRRELNGHGVQQDPAICLVFPGFQAVHQFHVNSGFL